MISLPNKNQTRKHEIKIADTLLHYEGPLLRGKYLACLSRMLHFVNKTALIFCTSNECCSNTFIHESCSYVLI